LAAHDGEINHKSLLKLAIPNIMANLSLPLAGLVDVALLGHLPQIEPLAGVALAGLIFDYVFMGFVFIRMSTTGLVAQALGAGDMEASAALFFRSLFIGLGLGSLMLLARGPIGGLGFLLLDGEALVEAQGLIYYSIRIWGAPASLGTFAVTGWLLGRHHVKSALILSVVLNGLNILLDYIFIFRLGWGTAGAAYATLIAEVTAFLVGLFLVRARWGQHPLPPLKRIWERGDLIEQLRLQANILIRSFCLVSTLAVFTNLSAHFGNTVLAANAILLRLLNTTAYFIDGFSHSLESMAGRFAGAQDWRAVRESLRLSLIWNISMVLLCITLFLCCGELIIRGLTSHDAVVASARVNIPYVCIALLFSGFAYIYDGLFLGLSSGKLMRNAMLVSIAGFLPIAFLADVLQRPEFLWIALIVFMALRALTLGRHTGNIEYIARNK